MGAKFSQKFSSDNVTVRWHEWKWQIEHSVKDINSFERLLGVTFSESEKQLLKQTVDKFPMSITPYYMSLIDVADYRNDPIFLQCFPSPKELQIDEVDMVDPLSEDSDSPVPGITHRYPDRVLFLISNRCAM